MFKSILVPVDAQEPHFAKPALKYAVDAARQLGAELHIMTVLPGYGMPLVASFFPDDALRKIREKAAQSVEVFVGENVPDDVNAQLELAEGRRPYEEIVNHAKAVGVDLIVIPSHHERGLQEVMLGSCASNVASHAPCSVLVLRS